MKKVFVSSTIWDLVDVHAELHEFLSRNGFQPVMSEYDDFVSDLSQAGTYEKCHQALIGCDIFLMIIGTRYGGQRDPKPEDISILHQELRWAREQRMEFICFIRDGLQHYYKTWCDNGKRTDIDYGVVKGKNVCIFDMIDEINTSAPDGTALWRTTFKDSMELKRRLATKLRIRDLTESFQSFLTTQGLNESWGIVTLSYEPLQETSDGYRIRVQLQNKDITLKGEAAVYKEQYLVGFYREVSKVSRRRAGAFMLELDGEGDYFGKFLYIDPDTRTPSMGTVKWLRID